jgi:2'-5' RNA ligase
MAAAEAPAATVRNHWWWRPGWRVGRHFYACHLTLDGQPQLRELVRRYQDAMAGLANLDLIPARWLHLTMQGIGFVDEISTTDLAAVTERLGERLCGLQPPDATFQQAEIWQEAVVLKAQPSEPLYQLRLAMYETIASVLGPAKFTEPRPGPGQFRPHVSIAYVNGDGPSQPIADALSNTCPQPVTVTFSTASVLVFHRDRRMYEWTQATPLRIGPGQPSPLTTPAATP